MSDTNKPIMLVIFQSSFTEFHYQLLEINHYKPEFEIVILDLSILLFPFSQKLKKVRYKGISELLLPKKWIDLLIILYKLRQKFSSQLRSQSISIYGATVFSLNSLIFHILFLLFFKKKFFAIIRLWNGGILVKKTIALKNQINFYNKIKKRLNYFSNIFEVKRYFKTKFFEFLVKLLPSNHTHILVAGSDWLKSLESSGLLKRNVKIILGHSFDYSAYLNSVNWMLKTSKIKQSLYLDTGSPKFLGDSAFSRRKVFYTNDKWYPALCRFFDFIEKTRGVQIIIAPHYKASHIKKPDYFNFREVVQRRTQELVTCAHEVLSVGSTATSFAVIYKKPIIFITSNQLNQDKDVFPHVTEMAITLNMPLINIDDPDLMWPILPRKVDSRAYDKYVSRCLSSTKLREPNFKIIKKLVYSK